MLPVVAHVLMERISQFVLVYMNSKIVLEESALPRDIILTNPCHRKNYIPMGLPLAVRHKFGTVGLVGMNGKEFVTKKTIFSLIIEKLPSLTHQTKFGI